mgnify:CR=1 FL=1
MGLHRVSPIGQEMKIDLTTARRRQVVYWIVAIGLTVPGMFGHEINWRGSAELHTIMETVATILAALIGLMALVSIKFWVNR